MLTNYTEIYNIIGRASGDGDKPDMPKPDTVPVISPGDDSQPEAPKGGCC